jgi:hypothetical protein
MSQINIPFGVDDRAYSFQETKQKDAVIIEALQTIAIRLGEISSKLDNLNSSTSKTKK